MVIWQWAFTESFHRFFVEWLFCKCSGKKNKSVPKVKIVGFATVKMVFNVLVKRCKNTYSAYMKKKNKTKCNGNFASGDREKTMGFASATIYLHKFARISYWY